MEFSAQQIAEFLGGSVEGDSECTVNNVSKIEEGKPGTLSFLANPKYTEYIYTTGASIVIVNEDFAPEKNIPDTCTLVRVADAYKSFSKLLEMYNQVKFDKEGVHPTATIEETASVGGNCYIGPNVYIGEHVIIGSGTKIFQNCTVADKSKIGEGCLLHGNVQIMTDCVIGNHCTIQAGAIIGSDGFGFAPNSEGQYDKVPQIGNVILEDHVDIGAGTTVDRATLGSTIIRRGAKIDNLIQIAHNVEIGENTVIAAQTGIAGSTKIGKNCMIGGQVGIVGHLKIGDGVKIAAQSGIGKDLDDKSIVQGSPAFGIGDYNRSYVGFRNLPKIQRQLNEIEKQLKELKDS